MPPKAAKVASAVTLIYTVSESSNDLGEIAVALPDKLLTV